MPPAKKPAARRSTSRRPARAARQTSTRAQVERATKRFEKSLDEASKALQALAKDAGSGAKTAYGDVTKALKALQGTTRKTNTKLLKDLEKLAAAPRKAAARPATRSTRSSGTTAKRSTAAKRSTTAKRGGATKRASGARRTTARSSGTRRAS